MRVSLNYQARSAYCPRGNCAGPCIHPHEAAHRHACAHIHRGQDTASQGCAIDGRHLAHQRGGRLCLMDYGDLQMIRIDALWLATAPIDIRVGIDTALARVVQVYSQGHPRQLRAQSCRFHLLLTDRHVTLALELTFATESNPVAQRCVGTPWILSVTGTV